MRLLQGLEDPEGVRARLSKMQPPEAYMDHLPAEDFQSRNFAWRQRKIEENDNFDRKYR